jgi:hypothetical protein
MYKIYRTQSDYMTIQRRRGEQEKQRPAIVQLAIRAGIVGMIVRRLLSSGELESFETRELES